jgi:hypothetical protein
MKHGTYSEAKKKSAQAVKFSTFYGARKVITVLTTAPPHAMFSTLLLVHPS